MKSIKAVYFLCILLTGCLSNSNEKIVQNSDSLITDSLVVNKVKTQIVKRPSDIPIIGDSIDWNQDTSRFEYLKRYYQLTDNAGNEKLIPFLFHFGINPFFQKSRIDFPLPLTVIRDNTAKQFELKEEDFNSFIFQKIIGLHWFPNGKKVEYQDTLKQANFVTVKRENTTNYYFELDSTWFLKRISIDYENGKTPKGETELFDNFLSKFISDEEFQVNRILFPFKKKSYDFEADHEKTIEINQNEWKPELFGYGRSTSDNFDYPFYGIYDNFTKRSHKMDTVKMWYSYNDNGIAYGFEFLKKNGKWYLIGSEDYSN